MASRIIPKEPSLTYPRWEMDAFEQLPAAGLSESCSSNPSAKDEFVHPQTPVALPTVEEIERIHQQAQQEGYGTGYEAGHEAGLKAGYEAGREQAAAELARFQLLFRNFQQGLANADQAIGNDLLALALGLAKQMVREALHVKPELVSAVVRECIQYEPVFSQPAQLFLNPEDAILVQECMNHELNDWTICADSSLNRGGCRIKIGNSHIDATVAARWQRIAQALGQNSEWLE